MKRVLPVLHAITGDLEPDVKARATKADREGSRDSPSRHGPSGTARGGADDGGQA
jgi:hypothetical protein